MQKSKSGNGVQKMSWLKMMHLLRYI